MFVVGSYMSSIGKYRSSLLVLAVYLLFTVMSFGYYKTWTLDDDLNKHILASDMFGVPQVFKDHGITPLFHGANESGWDGQFYYYMANDVLAQHDSAQHIDAPAYRYQRIGLSLYANIVSKIFGQNWVSPATYFFSYFFLIICATFAGTRLFIKVGSHPAPVLLWALSVGTQITLFNALPDAAADSFLILALTALFFGRVKLSVLPFIFSALSREAYVLFPLFILLFYGVRILQEDKVRNNCGWAAAARCCLRWHSYYWLILPGLIAVIWNRYLTYHFGVSPSSQAAGILNWPLASWADYLMSGLQHNHKLLGTSKYASYEAVSLILFVAVLMVSLWTTYRVYAKDKCLAQTDTHGLAVAASVLAFLYICFGSTVMMHYSGYIKALAIFFFLTPFLLATADGSVKMRYLVFGVLVLAFVATSFYNMKARILYRIYEDDTYLKLKAVVGGPPAECFGSYQVEFKVTGMHVIRRSQMSHFFGRGDQMVVKVELTNNGKSSFKSMDNLGNIYIAYHWVDQHGKVMADGIRGAVPGILLAGQSTEVTVLTQFPQMENGNASLILNPLQEGCAWFYSGNPKLDKGSALSFSGK